MSASQPVPSDPLSAAVAPASAPVAIVADKQEPLAAEKKKGSGGLLIGLGAFLLLLLVAGVVTIFFLLPPSAPAPATSSTPLAPDPGNPPTPPQFTLAAPVANPSGEAKGPEAVQLITAASSRLQARLLVGAGETTAPKDFIVRGGGASDAAGLSLPNHQRWEIQFPPGTTIEAYTRQLDFFKIELGVIGGSQNVTYLSNLSNPKPRSRVAAGNTDTRLYLIWNRGPMREADEILVARAGIEVAGKVLAHFCPPELEAEMLRVEAAQARTNNYTSLRRTVFGIQSAGGDTFRLVVTEQKGD